MTLGGVFVAFVVVALAACTSSEPGRGPAADDSFVPPSGGGDRSGGSAPPGDGRTIRGTLSFDDIEGGCAFLETAGGARYEVVYPDGWIVDRRTGGLRGPHGEDVPAGTAIEIAGSIARDRSSICQVGAIIVATRVTVPAP